MTSERIKRNFTPTPMTGLDLRDEALAAAEISILAIILFVAIIGNMFMIVAICKQLMLRPMSCMYYFMLHLSIADFLVAVFNILPQLIWDITYRFQGADWLCRLVKYLQVMVLYLSSYILMFMAIDRYKAVCLSGARAPWDSLRSSKIMVIASWTMAFVFAAPQAAIFTREEVRPGVYDCWGTFIQPWGAKAYVTWFVVSVFVAPLFVITLSYGIISYRIWSYSNRNMMGPAPLADEQNKAGVRRWTHYVLRPNLICGGSCRPSTEDGQSSSRYEDAPLATRQGSSESSGRQRHTSTGNHNQRTHYRKSKVNSAKIKTLKLTIVVVACFFVCWAPFCIAQLIMVYDPPDNEKEVAPVMVIFLLLASLNSCTNPWIYLVFSGSLFNHLRVCLGLGLSRSSNNDSIGDEAVQQRPQHKVPPIQIQMTDRRVGNRANDAAEEDKELSDEEKRGNCNDVPSGENVANKQPVTKSEMF